MIIQYGLWRSGSTLVWNILCRLFPEKNIAKVHKITNIANNKVVSTIRDPRDILASMIRINYKTTISQRIIDDELIKVKKLLDSFVHVTDKYNTNILILRYEDFWSNYDVIYDQLESFLNIKIPNSKRNVITEQVNVEKALEISKKFSSFKDYDKKTHIHGEHISSFKGMPSSWRMLIPANYHKYINTELDYYIKKLNYDI